MAYATIEDVKAAAGGEERLRALSDGERKGAVETAVVQRALDEAEELAKLHIGRRYGADVDVPISRGLTALVANEAVFILKQRRGMITEADLELHRERMALLEGVGAGRVTLGVATEAERSAHAVDKASARDTDKAIGRENLKGFW